MTNKVYIVANEQQEMAVLRELEGQGCKWLDEFDKPTEFIPSVEFGSNMMEFPYVIFKEIEFNFGTTIYIEYDYLKGFDFSNTEILFDGRKEEHMSEKYVVSQEFMDELEEWKNNLISSKRIYPEDISELYSENVIRHWWQGDGGGTDANNRLIAIIRLVNGEDVFEVEKPKKWVVRSKELSTNGEYHYGVLAHFGDLAEMNYFSYDADNATKFDTKEEAESWANSHQEVVEVVDV